MHPARRRSLPAALESTLRAARRTELAARGTADRRRAVDATCRLLLEASSAGWSSSELAAPMQMTPTAVTARIGKARAGRLPDHRTP
jgi:methylphosphotriester-DNA--protein-cysteine methyltransferase